MKPAPFTYHAATSVDEVLALLRDLGAEAKILAGGQSLVPLLNLRLAKPSHLVDVNRLGQLADIQVVDGHLSIGAIVRQRTAEGSPLIRSLAPLLAEALPLVGHWQIRNRGTIGGSAAHADPAAEIPTALAALDAELVVRSHRGERLLRPDQFFVGYLTTSLAGDELLVEIRIPSPPPATGTAFLEVSRRHGDFALVAVAALVRLNGTTISEARLAFAGVGPTPTRAREAERALQGEEVTPAVFAEAAQLAARGLDPERDIHASAAYRRYVAAALARRALSSAAERAQAG